MDQVHCQQQDQACSGTLGRANTAERMRWFEASWVGSDVVEGVVGDDFLVEGASEEEECVAMNWRRRRTRQKQENAGLEQSLGRAASVSCLQPKRDRTVAVVVEMSR